MILLFLGSWRSTIIIIISIPLSVLFSVVALSALGETINVMTLGGLALAVGMLVDEGTVTLENIFYHLEMGKPVEPAILDGAQQIVVPAFVTLLVLDIVFAPMFQLGGVRRLSVPAAGGSRRVRARSARSFSRARWCRRWPAICCTLTASMAADEARTARRAIRSSVFSRGLSGCFVFVRERYRALLARRPQQPRHGDRRLRRVRRRCRSAFGRFSGENFFPTVDSGQILDACARAARHPHRGNRSAVRFDRAERARIIPPDELDNIVDNIGLPFSGINMAYQNTGTIGPEDGDALISLKEDHAPTADYIKRLRTILPQKFPGTTFSFLPADIVSQILNFGLPAPIDVQVIGNNQKANYAYANDLLKRMRTVPGIADLRIQQVFNYPQINVEVDRTLAGEVGLTQRDVANSLLVTLSGSGQVQPNFWLNTQNGVSYPIVAQMPQYRIDTISDLVNLPVTSPKTKMPQYLGGLAPDHARTQSGRGVALQRAAGNRHLRRRAGARPRCGRKRHQSHPATRPETDLPHGSYVAVRGQVHTMTSAYSQLYFGLAGAVVLVYLVIVVNFQSWLDPFIIITALPGALAGIIWMLFMTGTTLSVPALTGAVMCMGIATANSVLLVSFAREGLTEGLDSATAALEAGFTRFRPVLMTALAMIIGMVPMAFALGEGGEQNAPLGRAVIGGLTVATIATLFFVPTVFSVLHRRRMQAQNA